MYYIDIKTQTFLHSDIHSAEQIPSHALEISEEQHLDLLDAINSGRIVFDDLTLSAPRPDNYHTWLDGQWQMTEENAAKKAADTAAALQAQIAALLQNAAQQVAAYQDLLDFAETTAEQEAGQAGLTAWRQYRAAVLKYQKGLIAELPSKPE